MRRVLRTIGIAVGVTLFIWFVAAIANEIFVPSMRPQAPPALTAAGGDPTLQAPVSEAHPRPPVIPWPPDYREDYAQLKGISKTIARIERESGLKALRDDANALRDDLSRRIPAGYQIDEQNGRFVQLPPPPIPPEPGPLKQPAKKPEKP
jgi:hypothetical protein